MQSERAAEHCRQGGQRRALELSRERVRQRVNDRQREELSSCPCCCPGPSGRPRREPVWRARGRMRPMAAPPSSWICRVCVGLSEQYMIASISWVYSAGSIPRPAGLALEIDPWRLTDCPAFCLSCCCTQDASPGGARRLCCTTEWAREARLISSQRAAQRRHRKRGSVGRCESRAASPSSRTVDDNCFAPCLLSQQGAQDFP